MQNVCSKEQYILKRAELPNKRIFVIMIIMLLSNYLELKIASMHPRNCKQLNNGLAKT